MRMIDDNAVRAKTDKEFKENMISEYEAFILHTAYKITGKYITKNDDQWSISLFAFHEAIQSYSYEKGRFLPFAELVIKRRLFDLMKQQEKTACETPINPASFGNDSEEEEDYAIRQQILSKTETSSNTDARSEIAAISQILAEYGFSFIDLTFVSPKAEKTKGNCAKAIVIVLKDPILLENMRRTKCLPIKNINQDLDIPRKIIERHRKYIIAAIEIISGDYPILSEYLIFVKKELLK